MNFTAPKNFKRGRLIANKYTVTDLLIAGAGVGAALFLEILFLTTAVSESVAANLIKAVIFMLPAMIGLLFVIPLGIYHNVFTLLLLLLGKLKKPKYYIWKGIESNVYQRQKKESSEKGAQV